MKYVKGSGKVKANKSENVIIDLGEEDGVRVGNQFKVFLTTNGVGVFEKVHTRAEITKVAAPHLAVGKVMDSELPVEKGYKVRKVEKRLGYLYHFSRNVRIYRFHNLYFHPS